MEVESSTTIDSIKSYIQTEGRWRSDSNLFQSQVELQKRAIGGYEESGPFDVKVFIPSKKGKASNPKAECVQLKVDDLWLRNIRRGQVERGAVDVSLRNRLVN